MNRVPYDLRQAIRRLRATPGFTIFAVLTLALGLGATTAIYSIVRAVTGPPPGVTTIDRLVNVTHTRGGSVPMLALSYGDYLDLRARQTVFQDLAGWAFQRMSLSANGQAGTGFGEVVSGEYFHVLGVQAGLGRTLQPADDHPAAPAVAVISHGIWQRMFGGSPDAIGQTIKVNGVTFEIVGVAPRMFAGLFNAGLIPSAAWLPLQSARLLPRRGTGVEFDIDHRSRRWIQIRARLKPGVTIDHARAEVSAIAQQLDREFPLGRDLGSPPIGYAWPRSDTSRPWVVRRTADVPINEGAEQLVRPMAATVMGAVILVLLVACTNLTNLLLARGSNRSGEMRIRRALGASRWRIVRESLLESGLLAVAGGLMGLGVARLLLAALGTDLEVGNGATLHVVPRIDLQVLALALVATLLALIVAGLLPALQTTRASARLTTVTTAPRWRGRRSLISLQVMVSLVLVAMASLCIAQIQAESSIDTGLDVERLALAQIDFASQGYEERRVRQLVDAIAGQIDADGRVDHVAVATGLPLGLTTPGGSVGIDPSKLSFAELIAGTPAIFDTLGIEIVHGRGFTAGDAATAPPVAIVSEQMAVSLFGRIDVTGQPIVLRRRQWAGEAPPQPRDVTIVGIARDTDVGSVGRRDRGMVYVPLDQEYDGRLVLVARTSGDPAELAGLIGRTVAAVDPGLAVAQSGTGGQIMAPESTLLRITAGLSGLLGTFALMLALAGLYGALSHIVTRRTREIGVRVALGAGRREILRMVLRDGLTPVLTGIVAGVAIGAIARVTMRPVFVRLLPAFDPFVAVVVPLLLLAAGAAACLLPARRAARVDPNVALREL